MQYSIYPTICFVVGLFQRAIMQSGCVFNSWAFNENHKEVAFKLAKQLGCQNDDPKEIVKYLKNIPTTDLVNASILDVSTSNLINIFYFKLNCIISIFKTVVKCDASHCRHIYKISSPIFKNY